MSTKELATDSTVAVSVPGNAVPVVTDGSDPNGKSNSYTGENIKILEGLEAVRLRPAMYIGSTGEMGLHHLVYEVVDNSVDEALAGHAKHVDVTIHFDNSITVTDDGRGIPVDDMVLPNGEKMPAVQVVLTKLHAGGKFDASNYKVSGGLHGVGVSCVNALSEEFEVEIWRDGHTYEQDYGRGLPVSKLRQAGTSKKRGTKIHFLPDRSIFTVTEYNYDTLAQRLRELAFLNKGLEITLTDERTTDAKTGEAKRAEFKYAGGIAEFIKHLNKGKQILHDKPIVMEASRDGIELDIALAVQRYVFRHGVQLREQYQHGGRRYASVRLPHGSDPHHQRGRAAAGPLQGREREPLGRRRSRGPGRSGERKAAAAAV